MRNNSNPKEIRQEFFKKGYYERARRRAKRRKSPWNLILIPLVLCGVGLINYSLFKFMWWIHTMVYPEHLGRLDEFWNEEITFKAFISSLLLLIPLSFASIPLGMMLANCIAWCIPPARKIFEKESEKHKGTSFFEAMSGLFFFAKYILPVCLLLSLIGALTLKNLK